MLDEHEAGIASEVKLAFVIEALAGVEKTGVRLNGFGKLYKRGNVKSRSAKDRT